MCYYCTLSNQKQKNINFLIRLCLGYLRFLSTLKGKGTYIINGISSCQTYFQSVKPGASNCAIAFWIIGVMNQGVAPMVGTPASGGSPYGQQVSLLVWFSLDSRILASVFSEHMQTIFLR